MRSHLEGKHVQIFDRHHLHILFGCAGSRRGNDGGRHEQDDRGELTKLGFQDFAGITMWLSGYYNASVRNTVIDPYQFAQAAKTVKDFCATSPRATVMSAAEPALGIKMPRPR
jgi:hypothetical protein